MKNLVFITLVTLFCYGCEKNDFDVDNPDVGEFIYQIKTGTYNCYEKGGNGENLWLIMPKFQKKHIPLLIDYSKDTSHIAEFPTNPMSSRSPHPTQREYYILGECLLWTVEGIRNGSGYGSLDPYLIDTARVESERFKGLTGNDLLLVRESYINWWEKYKDKDWKDKDPLEGTTYIWF